MARAALCALTVALMMLTLPMFVPLDQGEEERALGFTFEAAPVSSGIIWTSDLEPVIYEAVPVDGTLFNVTVEFKFDLLDVSQSEPCRSASVQLRRKTFNYFQTVQSTRTDDSGNAVFIDVVAGTYLVRIEADDGRWVRVGDGSRSLDPTYYWNTQQFQVDSDVSLDYHISDQARGAWAIYHDLRDGGEWLWRMTGWERSKVTVVWPEGDWPHSHGDEIHMPSDGYMENAVWRRDISLHEYGHCVHYELRGGNFPDGDGPDPHYIDSESSPGFAFTEGWAQFFERAVNGDPMRPDGSSLESTIFADGPFGRGDEGDMDGAIVEGAVANVLWDLFDGTDPDDRPEGSLGGDQVDEEFSTLWDIMYSKDPDSIDDIKREWPMRDADLQAVFKNSRVPMELDPPSNPTSFVSSHSVGEGSLDSTISLTWSGAIDGGSGVLGYSILIDMSPDALPDMVMDRTVGSYVTGSLSPGTYYVHIRTVDVDGNWAEDAYTIGPFVIDEGAAPVDDPLFPEGDLSKALFGLLVVLAVVGVLLLLIISFDQRSAGQHPTRPTQLNGNCPYCGRFDHGGEYCPYCGGRLR